MKLFTLTRLIIGCCLVTMSFGSFAQTGVLNPDDPVIIYNPNDPPEIPPFGTLVKWVKTTRVSFTTTSYKAYFYKGMAFRLKFPKTYKDSLNTNKKYPILVFFPGIGSKGTIYDNENQLAPSGQKFMGWVDNGTFDGFILCPETASASGAFNTNHFQYINELIENYFIPELKVDPFRVIVNGLSGGGGATWQMMKIYPTLVATGLPISAVSNYDADPANIANVKYTPIWLFQGGLDKGPSPFTARGVVSTFKTNGANITYTEYPNRGHNCWGDAWGEANFTVMLNKAHKANPWPLFGRTEYCPGEAISQVLGVTPGFDGYEWRKDGVLLSGAESNTYTATEKGVYDCRVKKGDTWSVWSPIPVKITEKGATISPAIQFVNPSSAYLPSPADPVSAQLKVPEGYATYTWMKEGDTTILSTANTLAVSAAGQYKVKVTEQYGCSSEFSEPFTIKNANAAGAPAPVSSFTVAPLSKTELKLDWVKGNSIYPETAFEIFKSSAANGTYELAAVVDAGTTTYTQPGLLTNTAYFFKVRAINAQAASAATNATSATTLADTTAPTVPANLRILSTTRSSVELTWEESTDDVAVTRYFVYVNGVKFQETDQNSFTVYNLDHGSSYVFQVRAADQAGNISANSNQVSAQPLQNGLSFKFYTTTDSWNKLPDFSTLTPFITGYMPAVSISNRTQDDRFGYLWEGYINIPTTGTYYFRTSSDEGSKIWLGGLDEIGSPYSYDGTAIVNNDSIHGSVTVTSAALTLQAGTYPIAIAYFDRTGGQSMSAFWRTPSTGSSYVAIPNTAFTDPAPVNGAKPAAPAQLIATAISYKRIDLTWADSSDNETAFEIWRSSDPLENFTMVGAVSSNTTSFSDTSALLPATRYYYQVRAVGQYGESAFAPAKTDAQAFWRFNNDYNDASGNARRFTAVNNPVFDNTTVAEPSYSLKFNGTNQYLDFVTATGDYIRGGFAKKSVTFWMKSNNNTGNRNVIDIGGRDYGLAIRLDANKVYAGAASNNIRYNVSAAYTNTDWHHIALVYDTNTLRLYVDGAEAGAVTGMTFKSIPVPPSTSSIGRVNSTNAFNVGTGLFDGWIDELSIFGKALTTEEVTAVKNRKYSSQYAETFALPAAPAVPAGFVAQTQSSSAIQLSWTDTAAGAASYELYRATTTTADTLLATLPATVLAYKDSLLKPNTSYIYKVRGINAGGASGFSAADTAATLNDIPVLAAIADQAVRFNDTLKLAVKATDTGNEALQFIFTGLPAFASFNSTGNGTGLLQFTPQLADTGTYHISVVVNDPYGGADTLDFNLKAHTNDAPAIAGIQNIVLNEKTTYQLSPQATDANAGDSLQWSFTGLPSFAVVNITAGSPQISLQPGYADNGVYKVLAKVEDGKGGADTTSFTITVNDVNPSKKIYVNFGDATYQAAAPWNNTAKVPAANDNFANLKDDEGTVTGVGVLFNTAWGGANNGGANTGNNSGVFPDAVLRSSYFTNATRTFKIYGLSAATNYELTMLASRAAPTVGVVGNYTVNGQTLSLNAANNSQNTITFNKVAPAADGSITVSVVNASGSMYAYLNVLVVRSLYDDSTAPARPRDLGAENQPNKVRLAWTDAAYNETSYEVYKATSPEGPYTLLTPGGNNANLVQYDDNNVAGNTTYYYTVRALNSYGSSPYSDTVAVTTSNVAPVLNTIANVLMATQQTATVNVTATDPGDVVALSVANLPSFAVFTDNGDGTGTIQINSGASAGTFNNITVTATDSKGATTSQSFNITVNIPNLTRVLVNFNQTYPVGAPWNSTNSAPTANLTLTNMKDETNASSGINLTLLDAWTTHNTLGVVTGNNSGVYPDDVMRTFYYYSGADERRVKLSGLDANKKYDLTFFASRANYTAPLVTRYTVGTQGVELNANNNSSQTVKIEGLEPDANGEIIFTAQKVAGTANTYLGALVIEAYPNSGNSNTPPANLAAAGIDTDKIQLSWGSVVNTTGYEIWRSSTATGAYSQIGQVPTGTLSYINTGLAPATVYYYKVRAIVNGTPGNFSNYAGASTVAYTVHLNLNDGSTNAPAQPGNWNNINTLMTEDFVLPNMINDLGQNTGIDFNLDKEFSGFNVYGATTGNNSGVYPDNVMKNFYYLNFADTAKIRITGLVLAHRYNFVFFGSRANPQTAVTTSYKIGSQAVILDAANNTSQTATITGVTPEADGSVTIIIYGANANGFGYLNAMSIEGVPVVQPDPALGINPLGRGEGLTAQTGSANTAVAESSAAETVTTEQRSAVVVYPNPFTDQVRLRFNLEQSTATVMVRVVDVSGRTVHLQKIDRPVTGQSVYQLNLPASLRAGMYFVEVSGLGGKKPAVLQLLKR